MEIKNSHPNKIEINRIMIYQDVFVCLFFWMEEALRCVLKIYGSTMLGLNVSESAWQSDWLFSEMNLVRLYLRYVARALTEGRNELTGGRGVCAGNEGPKNLSGRIFP